ncbi:MAG: 1-acyl-sn-glycerol-3-phosphate acyltransferase [Acidobacteriota bacterium]|nr:1-acyl-sn-glycerol-3-phosphate acyltransferase [Acidobacteriota bacterium]
MRLRAFRRAVALAFALAGCFLTYCVVRLRGKPSLEQRAQWLQSACRLVLGSLGIRYVHEGTPPRNGVIVANHLSYLDIAILSAISPCFFVAKSEIASWPYFGWAARTGGTLFLDRSSKASARRVADAIAMRLSLPVPVLFFPEGTSTDGTSVLPFHRGLFEPVVRSGARVTPAAISYRMEDGIEERELCWFGDAGFLPHLWKALAVRNFTAHVQFGEMRMYSDRRIAAEETHAEITAMRGKAISFPQVLEDSD